MNLVEGCDDRRVAVVHEWVDAYAGSEQVFEAIAQAFPTAELFGLSLQPGVALDVGDRPIRTTLLDHKPLRGRRSLTLPLMPLAWRVLGKSKYDLVISSHHAFAHTNRLADGGIHLSYVHSPARYLWSPDIDSRAAARMLGPARAMLRTLDLAASRRVTAYAANSSAVAQRIQDFWGRTAVVIHPPVRIEYFGQPAVLCPTRDYVLGVGRWIPYKNLHLVIEAAAVAGMAVKIAGSGPDKPRIVAAAAAARVPTEIIESPSDDRLRELYRNAACLVFPTVEDFGIVPVEAQAAGTPVVALRAGGAIETVQDGRSGFLASEPDVQELATLIGRTAEIDPELCTASAARFSRDIFTQRIRDWVAAAS